MADVSSLGTGMIAVAIGLVAVALLGIGSRLIRELRLHRESLRGIEARLRGIEDAVVGIYKELRSRGRERE